MMSDSIQLLDATLRDGRLGLEDAYINDIEAGFYTHEQISSIANLNRDAGYDIIELGSIESSQNDKTRFAIYQNIEEVSQIIPKRKKEEQLYVAMFRGPDTPIEALPEHNDQLLDGVRVILRYSELRKSLDFCEALAVKGYKVFIQPMLTMRYSDEELVLIVEYANRMNAYSVYFVDSYGYMESKDVIRLYNFFNERLNSNVRIGFHAHNNINLAFANAITFIEQAQHTKNRKIILDSCATGMGQGTGNLQSEIIANYLNEKYDKHYDYSSILDVCEIVSTMLKDNTWGYSVTRLLPAIHHAAYKYAVSMRHKYHLTFNEIDSVFRDMPNDLKQRYTPDNLKNVLKAQGYEVKQ